jgi:hypothetical protein
VQIVSAYNELGSYRAAAELCGTTHKTVRRVVERQRAGGLPPPRKERPKNTAAVADLVAERVRVTDGRISAKRLLPAARAAGYEGSARNLRRLVADAKPESAGLPALGAQPRRPPGDRLDARRRPADVRRRARLVPLPLRALRRRSAAGDDAAAPRRVPRGDRRRARSGAVGSDGGPSRQRGRRAGGAPPRLRALRGPLRLSPRLLLGGRPGVEGGGGAPHGLRPARPGRARGALCGCRAGQRRRQILVRGGERAAALGDPGDPRRAPCRRGRAPSPAARAAPGAGGRGRAQGRPPGLRAPWLGALLGAPRAGRPAGAGGARGGADRDPPPGPRGRPPRAGGPRRGGHLRRALRRPSPGAGALAAPAHERRAGLSRARRAGRALSGRRGGGRHPAPALRDHRDPRPRGRLRARSPGGRPRARTPLSRYRAADVRAILAAGAGVGEVVAAGAPLSLALPAAPARALSAYAPWSRP